MIDNNSETKCFICGERNSHASWVCHGGELSVCSICATTTLPQLIGDSVFGGLPANVKNKESNSSAVKYVQEKLEQFQSKYFESIAKASLSHSFSLSNEECEKRGQQIMNEMNIKLSKK